MSSLVLQLPRNVLQNLSHCQRDSNARVLRKIIKISKKKKKKKCIVANLQSFHEKLPIDRFTINHRFSVVKPPINFRSTFWSEKHRLRIYLDQNQISQRGGNRTTNRRHDFSPANQKPQNFHNLRLWMIQIPRCIGRCRCQNQRILIGRD